MSEQNIDHVRGFQDAFNRRDRDAMCAAVHADFEFIPILATLEGRVYRGPEGLMGWLDEVDQHWELFEICPDEYHDLGERVLCLGAWRARGRTSGVELEGQPGAWVVDLEDGLIRRSETFTNRADAFAAAGLDGS